MLLDEPEIHLHPLLQLQVLQYMRNLANRGAVQFILTTHSPTLLDALSDDELYLLSPAALSPENQLARLTNSEERLEVAREITGSTHLLTRAKPIVFVEGETERGGLASDVRVIASLLPATRSWALVPSRAKADVLRAVERLRLDSVELPGLPVFGLVDADRDDAPADDHIVAWPVTMIENFLLHPEAIFEVLQPFGNQTRASSPASVAAVLQDIVTSREEEEVQLRVQAAFPVGRLTIRPSEIQTLNEHAERQAAEWMSRVRQLNPPQLVTAARAEVLQIAAEGRQLERFHGKRVLHSTFEALGVSGAGLSKAAFALSLASNELVRDRAQALAMPAVRKIQLYFPRALQQALRDVGTEPALVLADTCVSHLDDWDAGTPRSDGRKELRDQVFALARSVFNELQRKKLVGLAAEIGTA